MLQTLNGAQGLSLPSLSTRRQRLLAVALTPPVLVVAPEVPNPTPFVGDVYEESSLIGGTWYSSGPMSLSRKMLKNGVQVDLPYTVTLSDEGAVFQVEERAENAAGSSVAVSEVSAPTIRPFEVPVNTSLPTLNVTSPTVGHTYTSGNMTPGTWTGYPAPIITRMFLRNGSPVALPYQVVVADAGVQFSVQERAVNAAAPGGVTVSSAPTNPVPNNLAPTFSSPSSWSIESGTSTVGTVVATDPEGQIVKYRIKGGSSASLFTINETTGVLSFPSPPVWQDPNDTTFVAADGPELHALLADPNADGKEIRLMPGSYIYNEIHWSGCQYDLRTTVRSFDPDNRALLHFAIPGQKLSNSRNLHLHDLDMQFDYPNPVSGDDVTTPGLGLNGINHNLWITYCRLSGDMKENTANGFTPGEAAVRGLLGFGNSGSKLTGDFRVENCILENGSRLANLIGGDGQDTFSIRYNVFQDFGSDCLYVTGRHGQVIIEDNLFWRPFAKRELVYEVVSINTETREVTLATPHAWGIPGAKVTINWDSTSTLKPVMSSGNKADQGATVVSSTVIRMTNTFVDVGSGVRIKREQTHTDFIQGAFDSLGYAMGGLIPLSIRRNIILAIRDDQEDVLLGGQPIFLEDLNGGKHPDGTHPTGIIADNFILTDSGVGICAALGYNLRIFGNTCAALPGSSAIPRIAVIDHWNGTAAGNIVEYNIGRDCSGMGPGSASRNNIITPNRNDYSTIFVNPGTPTSVAEAKAMYAVRLDHPSQSGPVKIGSVGAGYANFDDYTSAHPAEPADFYPPVITNVGGVATGAHTADIWAETNDGKGQLYLVLSTLGETSLGAPDGVNPAGLATRPRPEQMIACQDRNGPAPGGSIVLDGTPGQKTVSVSGAVENTVYYTHAMQVDEAGNFSLVKTSTGTLTTQPSVVMPTISGLSALPISHDAIGVSVTTDVKDNGTLFLVATDAATPPSGLQIANGQDQTGVTALASASQAVGSLGVQTERLLQPLNPTTGYYIHAVQRDASNNYSNVLSSGLITTLAASTFGAPAIFDGSTDRLNRTSLVGASDSKTGTLAFALRPDSSANGTSRQVIALNGSRVSLQIRTSDVLRLDIANSAGAVLARKDLADFTTIAAGGAWAGDEKMYIFSWDLENGQWHGYSYSGGVATALSKPTLTNDAVDLTGTSYEIGAFNNATRYKGDLRFLYFDDYYVDLSSEAGRKRFLTPSALRAESARRNGALILYLDPWTSNEGSGGDFTLTGSLG